MPLSNEDNLRLNILLAQDLKAVRIDESKMIVYALSAKGEGKIQLNPNSKDEKYIKLVKELLSQKIMGSPGGYPVYIKRWTRMGQERREESLAQLLLLGEQEAVIAVVHAPQLSAEIAQKAWWALPSSANARQLLEKKDVAASSLARELAEFLLEFLPFEVEHNDMIDSVRLCLQPGLLTATEIEELWKRAKRKQSLYVGFLHSLPDDLPEQGKAHALYADLERRLNAQNQSDNIYLNQLQRYLSEPGQVFLNTVLRVIDKAASQDTIVSMFHAFCAYNQHLPLAEHKQRSIEEAIVLADGWLQDETHEALYECVQLYPEYHAQIRALLILAQMGEVTLYPIFGLTDALGTVMRKKLKPLTDPLIQQLRILCD